MVLARQDEIQDDLEDVRVAKTPSFDAEDDAIVPLETSEFAITPPASPANKDRPDATETPPNTASNQEGGSA